MQTLQFSPDGPERTQVLVDLAGTGRVLVDVGTDHAQVPCAAVRRGRFERAIGVDKRPSALAQGRRTVARYGLGDRVDLRLGDGFEPVRPGEAEVAVLAGMGAETLLRILARAPALERLVVQPNHDLPRVREALARMGWCIVDERLGVRRNRVFPTMRWEPGTCRMEPADLWLGPVLRRGDDPLFGAYREAVTARLRAIALADPGSVAARILPELE